MARAALLLLSMPAVTAFTMQPATSGRAAVKVNAEMSKALPFLPKPEKLDGTMAGDVGFDPIGISDTLPDLQYARFAEIKNGRVAMMACLGFMVEEVFQLPGEGYANSDPIGAIATVPLAANLQILMGCAIVELATLDITYGDGEPGDYGWDPAKLTSGKSEAWMADMKLKEIKNGRLAMVAFIGMLVQNLWFHEKLFEF